MNELPSIDPLPDSPTRAHGARHSDERGFTLVEILVALAILGILGTVVIREIFHFVDDAKQEATKAKVDTVHQIVEQYRYKHSQLPRDLRDLLEPDDYHNGEPWLQEDQIYDSWNNPLELKFGDRTSQFEVVSYGADGSESGYDLSQGLDRDISSKVPLVPVGDN